MRKKICPVDPYRECCRNGADNSVNTDSRFPEGTCKDLERAVSLIDGCAEGIEGGSEKSGNVPAE